MVDYGPDDLPRFLFTGAGLQFSSASGTIRWRVFFIPHTIDPIGEIAMPTPKEYRLRADECLELTNEADEWYVKTALLQLAAEFQKRAARLERSTQRS
jgi:hypothetical protein